MADEPWLVARPDGVELVVKARPGAKRSEVVGVVSGALCVRVAARPVEGAANLELLRVLAEVLGVGTRTLALRSGARSRAKRIRVVGLGAAQVMRRLTPYL